MHEFELIQFLKNQNSITSPYVQLGIGDDAAIVNVPDDFQLVSSIDTSIQGVHFPAETKPYDIAYKSLAVSLSDMAAMGAEPIGILLALTLPEINKHWVEEFARGFFALVEEFKAPLIGGDTTRGALSISTVVQGLVPQKGALLRSGAKVGDLIYVSGYLGDAGLALQEWRAHKLNDPQLQRALNRPLPRVNLGLALRSLATSAIDISDGFAQDLTHILKASRVGAAIHLETLPLSEVMLTHRNLKEAQQLALQAGDDYELCFTINPKDQMKITALATKLNLNLTCIGQITNESELKIYEYDQLLNFDSSGYQHF